VHFPVLASDIVTTCSSLFLQNLTKNLCDYSLYQSVDVGPYLFDLFESSGLF